MSFKCTAITTETPPFSTTVYSTHQPHKSKPQDTSCRVVIGDVNVATPAAYLTDCSTA